MTMRTVYDARHTIHALFIVDAIHARAMPAHADAMMTIFADA